VCKFRDIIPSEAQRPQYEAMVKKAREEWLASQRESDAEYRKQALKLALEAMKAAELRQRKACLAAQGDSGLLLPASGQEYTERENALLKELLVEIDRRAKEKERTAKAKEDAALQKRLAERSDAFWKKALEQYALEKKEARRQDRAAYLDGARKYAEDAIRRKWKELQVKAKLEGKPEPPAMDSGEGRKIFLRAMEKAGYVTAQAEEEAGRPATFEEDKILKGRLTRAVGTVLSQGYQAYVDAQAALSGKEAYLAEAEKKIRSVVSEVFEEQYQALQKVYPACALPAQKGGRCQTLQTEIQNEMLLRVREHQKTGAAKEEFAQERLLISSIREDTSFRVRSRLTAMIEEEMGKFRKEYMTLALARSSEMARIAYRAVRDTKMKKADGSPALDYPQEDFPDGKQLIGKCEKELEALLRKEILTRHVQVAAGYESDQGMQDMLRTAAVKFYMEKLLPVQGAPSRMEAGTKKTGSGTEVVSSTQRVKDANTVGKFLSEEFEKAYRRLQADYPAQVLPQRDGSDCTEVKKHAADAGISRFSAWRRGELREKCPTEQALHDLVRGEIADRFRMELKQLADRQMQPLMHTYLQKGGERIPLMAGAIYKSALDALQKSYPEMTFPDANAPQGEQITEESIFAGKKRLEEDAQTRRGKVAGGYDKDAEEHSALRQAMFSFCYDRIRSCGKARTQAVKPDGPGRPAAKTDARGALKNALTAAAAQVIASVLKEQRKAVEDAHQLIHSTESPTAFQGRMTADAAQMIEKYSSEKALRDALEAHIRREYAKRASPAVTQVGCRVNVVERKGLFGRKTVKEKRVRLNMPGQDNASKRPVLSNVRDGDTLRLYFKDCNGKDMLCKAALTGKAKGLATIWTEKGEDGRLLVRIGGKTAQESILWKDLWCW